MVKDNLLFGNEMIHWSYELAKFLKPPELIEQTKELVFTIKVYILIELHYFFKYLL